MTQIINTWDQMVAFGGDRIAVTFSQNGGRSVLPPWWAVFRLVGGKERATDPKAPYWAHGCKTFCWAYGKEEKKKALAKALAWVASTYGRKGLVRNAMGDFVEAEVQAKYPIKRQRAAGFQALYGGRRPMVKNPNFGAQYGGHHYPMSESTFGNDVVVFPGSFAIEGPLADRIGDLLAGKEKVKVRPRGKRK